LAAGARAATTGQDPFSAEDRHPDGTGGTDTDTAWPRTHQQNQRRTVEVVVVVVVVVARPEMNWRRRTANENCARSWRSSKRSRSMLQRQQYYYSYYY